MEATLTYKPESIESFKSIDNLLLSCCYGPRDISNIFRLEKVSSAKPFLAVNTLGVIVDTNKADELISQARNLRKTPFWFLWKMYAPSRKVVDATVSVIRLCPSDLFLEGFRVANYGNGTVVLMRKSRSFYTTINVGSKAVSYAKLRLSDQQIVASGRCSINKDAIRHLFETL